MRYNISFNSRYEEGEIGEEEEEEEEEEGLFKANTVNWEVDSGGGGGVIIKQPRLNFEGMRQWGPESDSASVVQWQV